VETDAFIHPAEGQPGGTTPKPPLKVHHLLQTAPPAHPDADATTQRSQKRHPEAPRFLRRGENLP